MSNAVIETILSRRSIRKFLPEQLKPEQLEIILEAGRAAPSGSNSQTTHYLVIQNQSVLLKLADIATAEFRQMQPDALTYRSLRQSIERSQITDRLIFYYGAPTLIVAANQKGYGNALADSACGLENMMIAAASLSVGSCWINQLHWLDDSAAIRAYLESLGLGRDETITGSLALGYAAEQPDSPLPRTGNRVTMIP